MAFFQDNLGELVSETVKDSSFNSVVLCASNYSVRTDPEPGKFQSSLNLELKISKPGKSWGKGVGFGKSWKMKCSSPGFLLRKICGLKQRVKVVFFFMGPYNVQSM